MAAGWSSARSTRRPRKSGGVGGTGSPGSHASSVITSGNRNQKVDPRPSVLSTPISPPMSSTSRLEMDNPRPVPPNRRAVEPSACVKGWKSFFFAVSERPMPLSCTLKRTCGPLFPNGGVSSRVTRSTTEPTAVNLMALPSKLSST